MQGPYFKHVQQLSPGRARRGLLACRNYPAVYLNIPKSACTTCKNILYRVDTGSEYPEPIAIHGDLDSLLRYRDGEREAFDRAIALRKVAFTFVREPFSRCYSAFNDKIFHLSKYSFRPHRKFIVQQFGGDFDFERCANTAQRHSDNFLAFLRFVRANLAGETARWAPDPHWMEQKLLVDSYRAVVCVDMVGRVEEFQAGMRYVLGAIGYQGDADLSVRYNEGPKLPFTLDEVMNDVIHAALHDLYEGDLVDFGYRCAWCSPQGARTH